MTDDRRPADRRDEDLDYDFLDDDGAFDYDFDDTPERPAPDPAELAHSLALAFDRYSRPDRATLAVAAGNARATLDGLRHLGWADAPPAGHALVAWRTTQEDRFTPGCEVLAHLERVVTAARRHPVAAPLIRYALGNRSWLQPLLEDEDDELERLAWLGWVPEIERAAGATVSYVNQGELHYAAVTLPPERLADLLDAAWDDLGLAANTLVEAAPELGEGEHPRRLHPLPDWPALPEEWHRWPLDVQVSFVLVEGCCVYQGLFDEFRREDLASAARTVFRSNDDLMPPRYRVCTPGAVPHVGWYYDRPLVAGRHGELSPRGIVDGVAPWDGDLDDTLVEIYRYPVEEEGEAYRYGLRTAGVTPDHALAAWRNLAPWLRRLMGEERATR